MTASWTVGTAIDALYAGIKARPGLAGIEVHDGWPPEESQALECIWIADSTNQPTVSGFRGGASVKYLDDYRLDIFTEVRGPGRTAKNVRDRVLVLNAEVEAFIAANTHLGTGITQARLASQELMQLPITDGRRALVRNTLNISGRR